MNGIQGIFTYLSENIRDPKEKKILEKINYKYGPIYMIASLSKKKTNGNNEPTNEHYYPPLIKEAEFKPESLQVLEVCDTLPQGRFTSFRFFMHYKSIVENNVFLIKNETNTVRIEIQLGGIYYNSNGITPDSFMSPAEKTYQVNIGWNNNNELLLEWYQEDTYFGLYNISTLSSEYTLTQELLTNASYSFFAFDNSELTFFTPNKNYISETFMNNYT